MNFGAAKLTVSAMVIEDSRNMCGNLHPNSVSRVLFSGLITLLRHPRLLFESWAPKRIWKSSMFQIHKRIFWDYRRNFRRLPIYGFAHVKVKNSIFNSKILEVVGDIAIILNNFEIWFYFTTYIWENWFGYKIFKFPEFNLVIGKSRIG